MFAALSCLGEQHDLRLLGVALAICLGSVWTGLAAHARAIAAKGWTRTGWCAFFGVVTGSGVWATHFVSMLAYRTGLQMSYGLDLTALSLAAAVAILGCGAYISSGSRRTLGKAVGGGVIGLGVAAMHFVGVAAISTHAIAIWNGPLAAAAVIPAVGFAAAAMVVARRESSPWRTGVAVALLGLAILALHFTAMSAMTLLPGPAALHPPGLGRVPLALTVAGVTALMTAAAVALLSISHLASAQTLRSLQSALDAAPTAIGFFDATHRLTFWNRRYAELFEAFGTTPSVGLKFEDILAAATAAGLSYERPQPKGAEQAPSWDSQPGELALPDGRVLQANTGPSRDGGMIAVLFDVTEARRAERLSHEARERAEAASRSKSDFLATMSHEIRTPLNGVLGMAYVMESHALAPDQRERLKILKSSGEGLLSLLNDLLDLAKIEAGRLELEDVAFDLEALLSPTMNAFASMAATKDLAFTVTYGEAVRGDWRGDPTRFRQVVTNLVANAVKFTMRGEVAVTVDACDAGVRVEVRDTGIGMKADQIPRLFEKFTQADSSSTRVHGGTGLGLAICHDVAELMGGALEAESVENEGSTFIFTAPLVHTGSYQRQARAEHGRPADQAPLRVLVAEDNLTNQIVIRALLEPFGAEVVIAVDGEDAVAAYDQGAFDLVLMDVQMPRLGGIEAARRIRALEARGGGVRTPIVALTANVMTHQVQDYLAAGMDDVIAKPIQPAHLYALLGSIARSDEEAPAPVALSA